MMRDEKWCSEIPGGGKVSNSRATTANWGKKREKKMKAGFKRGCKSGGRRITASNYETTVPSTGMDTLRMPSGGEIMTNSIRTIPYIWNILDLLSWMNNAKSLQRESEICKLGM